MASAFQTKQGNRPYFRDQEERKGSDEVVPGTSVLSLSESRVTFLDGTHVLQFATLLTTPYYPPLFTYSYD